MKSLRKRLRGKKGFSLPEILVSCVIGLIGISAILSSFLGGRLSSAAAQHHTQAMNVARARMEYMKSLTYSDLTALPAVTAEPELSLDQRGDGIALPCMRYTIVNAEQGGITIGVMVTWNEKVMGGSTPLNFQLRTWVCHPGQPGA